MKRGEVRVDNLEELTLSTISADLEVIPHEDSCIEYEVYGEEEEYEPEIVVMGSKVTINFEKTRLGKKMIFGLISIPDVSSVDKAVVRVPKSFESLKLKTVSGEVRLSSVECSSLKLSSVSGEFTVEGVVTHELSGSSVSGDLHIDDVLVKRELQFSSVSGDCRVSLKDRPPRRVQLATTSGDVLIKIEKVPPMEVRVSCVSGDFVHNLNLSKVAKNVYRNADVPDCEFKLTSVSGDVVLKGSYRDVVEEDVYEEVEGSDQQMEDEAQRIKRMFEDGKLTREQATQILETLGYSEQEIVELLGSEKS